jgi:transposase
MVAIPTINDEDAKRPNRERENLVGEQSRIINRIKATLARLGIRGFNPKLKKAAERLGDLRTPEGEPIAPNTLSELRRDMERRRLVGDQIRQIESARLDRLEHAPDEGPHAMVRLLARVMGIGIETADMLVQEVLSRNLRDRRAVALRPHWLARREREEAPRERAGARRESSGSAGHDPIGVAISPVPEGQRLGAVVPSPHRECPRHSQNHDRGLGAQASDRPVAARAGRRGAGRLHSAFRTMTEGRTRHPTVSARPFRL